MLDEILAKINAKGWEMYQISNDETLIDAVPRGPAQALEDGADYLVLPRIAAPTNLFLMQPTLKHMVETANYPLATLRGAVVPLGCVGIRGDDMLIRYDLDVLIPLEEMLPVLETLAPNQGRKI